MTYELRIFKDGRLERHDTIEPKTSLQIDAVLGFPGMSVRLEYQEDPKPKFPESPYFVVQPTQEQVDEAFARSGEAQYLAHNQEPPMTPERRDEIVEAYYAHEETCNLMQHTHDLALGCTCVQRLSKGFLEEEND